MALASLVSFQEQKQNQKHYWSIRFTHTFLKAKAPKFAPIRDALYLPFKIEREFVIREEVFLKFLWCSITRRHSFGLKLFASQRKNKANGVWANKPFIVHSHSDYCFCWIRLKVKIEITALLWFLFRFGAWLWKMFFSNRGLFLCN